MKKLKTKQPGTLTVKDVSALSMVAGGEKRHPVIIHEGSKKQWVGFGWVDEGPATDEDRAKYPEVL
jgi:hypothetical protein